MAWIYLALALVGAWLTFNVWRPRHGVSSPVGNLVVFLGGWLYGEAALHQLVFQWLVAGAFVYAGVLESAVGQVGLAIQIASSFGLLAHWWLAFSADERVEAALTRAFGPQYAERVRPDWSAKFRYGLDWGRILWPFTPRRNPRVERVADIQFGRERGIDLHLDVYRPAAGGQKLPVLFQIHGGGWSMGSKNEQALPLIYHFAERGWICVATSYRLSPHATFPEHLIDCKRALRWVRENIADYGGDPDFVVATGGSAGGHLCTMLALTPNEDEYQPGFESVDTAVNGCVSFYGVYDFTNRFDRRQNQAMAAMLSKDVMKASLAEDPAAYRAASPMSLVRADAPPFLIVHGDSDSLVSVEDARGFADQLGKESTSAVAYLEVAGAQHAFEMFESVRTQHATNCAERFCAAIYSDHLARARPRYPGESQAPASRAPGDGARAQGAP